MWIWEPRRLLKVALMMLIALVIWRIMALTLRTTPIHILLDVEARSEKYLLNCIRFHVDDRCYLCFAKVEAELFEYLNIECVPVVSLLR